MAQDQETHAARKGIWGKYAYGWLTLGFFLVSMLLHWWFGWKAFQEEAANHGQTPELASFAVEAARDTFENWQSEFLQLLWQVAGLAYFLYLGSPASKENDDRMEAKIDALLRLQGDKGSDIIRRLDRHYLRAGGHAQPHGHEELEQQLGTT